MRNLTKLFAISIVLISFAASSFAQVTATANASAIVIAPITISATRALDFGSLAVNATDGSIALSTASAPTPGGGVTLIGGTPTSAIFRVTGTGSESFSFSLPASILLSDGATHTMLVDAFVHNAPANIPGAGTVDINVGATLNVTGGQTPGTYTNTTTLTATVNYN